MDIMAILNSFDLTKVLAYAAMIYGILAAIVKAVPTIPAKYPWLIAIMKFLGNITNDQTDNAAVRASQTTVTK